jgi:glycosyltransferase involved in cell wall biosynthesis
VTQPVIINWTISSFFGWGVYGLNLALHWSRDPELNPSCPLPLQEAHLAVTPEQRAALEPFVRESAALRAQLPRRGGALSVNAPVLASLEHRFQQVMPPGEPVLFGRPTLGLTFFQDTVLAPDAIERANGFAVIVAGSTWNLELMRAQGIRNVELVIQGIDPALFHPGPRQGRFGDRFVVFSGGKLERRKGQDIVMAAFRRFAARRPKALLLTAWHSPWTEVAASVDESGLAAPLPMAGGRIDVAAWGRSNGLRPDQVADAGVVPNARLPLLLREADVAVFPNRAEGGTNLVAMECMACGVPTVLSANTGHLDLIEDGNCYVLERQGALSGLEGPVNGVPGWGESDVEEVVEALERAYLDRQDARRRGERGAATLARFSWAETARRMKALVLRHASG